MSYESTYEGGGGPTNGVSATWRNTNQLAQKQVLQMDFPLTYWPGLQ